MNILCFSEDNISSVLSAIEHQLCYDPHSPMIFNSGLFLFLFLAFSFIYATLKNHLSARLVFVTAFSYYFYYKSSGFYFFLLAIVTTSDWLLSRLISKVEVKGVAAKSLMIASLCIDLGLLGYFKYTNFFCSLWSDVIGGNFQPYDIFLPVGISFFTFQSLSYTIDVYRGDIKPIRSLLDYAFYVSFFPQLVAGPIVRARDFVPQIRKPINITPEMFGTGIFLIAGGLFKKAVISDYISVNFVERIFDNPALYSGLENLMGIYGYALQIYCDFSGYSDMAIGIALLLGFHFPINFNSPYKSDSISDFWRRWHISLSTWIRDYIYISLGGNRKGKIRTYVNLIITMLLGGLWHGASLNFVLWGGLHGVALAIHKAIRQALGRAKGDRSKGWKKVAAIILTFHFVCFCWVFFRNTSFESSWLMFRQIFCDFRLSLLPQLIMGYKAVFALILLGYTIHYIPDSWQTALQQRVIRMPLIVQALLIVTVTYIVIQVKSSDIQPFIYFQF